MTRLTCIAVLVPGFLASGCLAPDPDLDPNSRVETGARIELERELTAPLQIDPAILAGRRFNEAPMLAERVGAGALPPVAERLPENPLVVVPMEEIGAYGGKIRRALTGDIIQTPGVRKTLSENLMGYERPSPKSIQLGLAESCEFLDGGRVAVFKIRRGIKWSDGVPFTVDDILFWYYDMIVDDDARNSPVFPTVWMVGGEPIRLGKIDDYTLRVSSPKPLGRVLNALSLDVPAYPKHVLAQHHPRYNPDASYETFREQTTDAQLVMQPGLPRLSAWVPAEWTHGQRLLYERNPYYWKVDTEGNQLPYADYLEFTVIQDPQVILLKFINGELDLFGRYAQIDMFPTLRAEEDKGRFALRITGPERGPAFYLNWDTPKEALRRAFRDLRVRMALSHAVNREEINQIVYYGLLEPSGYSYGPSNPYYSADAYHKYAEFDRDKARALLDSAGYRDADGDGYRELQDGARFELNIDVVPGVGVDVSELVAEHWREIGVKANLNIALRDILWPRRVNGDFDIHFWVLEGPADPLGRLDDWAIMGPSVPFWHRRASEEGPEWLRQATRDIQRAITTIDTAEIRQCMTRARDLHTDNVPVIVIGSAYHVWGVSTRLGNVPYENSAADVHRGWGRPVFHEQIYVKESQG